MSATSPFSRPPLARQRPIAPPNDFATLRAAKARTFAVESAQHKPHHIRLEVVGYGGLLIHAMERRGILV